MSISINSNYILNTNNTKANLDKTCSKSFLNAFNEAEEKKLTEEEDKILYEALKKAGVDLVNHSLEWHKEHLVAFPPLTAPGIVRRAWREALSKVPEGQRGDLAFKASILFNEEMKRDKKMVYSNNGGEFFTKVAEYMLDKNEKLKSFISDSDYSLFKELINNFKDGLSNS